MIELVRRRQGLLNAVVNPQQARQNSMGRLFALADKGVLAKPTHGTL